MAAGRTGKAPGKGWPATRHSATGRRFQCCTGLHRSFGRAVDCGCSRVIVGYNSLMDITNLNAATTTDYVAKAYGIPTGWAYRQTYGVGHCGSTRRGTSGAKVHLLRVDTVIAVPDSTTRMPGQARAMKVGDVAGVRGCNSNGQRTGVVLAGKDLNDITCTKCAKRLAAIVAGIDNGPVNIGRIE